FFFQAEDGIRDFHVTGVQTCALPIFEARGTSGPSYMLMEVNDGNSEMVKGFAKANPRYPVSNSLMYSIYKTLPNDTDLTVFRERSEERRVGKECRSWWSTEDRNSKDR